MEEKIKKYLIKINEQRCGDIVRQIGMLIREEYTSLDLFFEEISKAQKQNDKPNNSNSGKK